MYAPVENDATRFSPLCAGGMIFNHAAFPRSPKMTFLKPIIKRKNMNFVKNQYVSSKKRQDLVFAHKDKHGLDIFYSPGVKISEFLFIFAGKNMQ